MADRRRINGPSAVTTPPIFYGDSSTITFSRSRTSNELRNFFLKTAVTPSASGSAYLEVESHPQSCGLKLLCTVHGPHSLSRSAPFSPHLVLSTHVKYAPFATRTRRGYAKDVGESDLEIHLEAALRGSIITDRWPKSGLDVVVTILEADMLSYCSLAGDDAEWDVMNVLGGCISVASAAVVDAGIDCIDTATSGVAALVQPPDSAKTSIILDPAAPEHGDVVAACCVAYLPSRGEITNLWIKGRIPPHPPNLHCDLIEMAIQASRATSLAISDSLREAVERD